MAHVYMFIALIYSACFSAELHKAIVFNITTTSTGVNGNDRLFAFVESYAIVMVLSVCLFVMMCCNVCAQQIEQMKQMLELMHTQLASGNTTSSTERYTSVNNSAQR